MGLQFSHGGASFSYGGFNYFREQIAKTIQITLSDMENFGGAKQWPLHPLTAFLNHSDCNGHLTPQECKVIIPALEKAIAQSFSQDSLNYDRGMDIIFGMTDAIEKNENFEFL